MIRNVLAAWFSLFICYGAISIAQGYVDQDSLYSLLIMMGVALFCATITAIRRPRSRITTRHQTTHRRYEERHEFAAFDDSDVERLRRQWRADVYDRGLVIPPFLAIVKNGAMRQAPTSAWA